jgi:hypothetical protein
MTTLSDYTHEATFTDSRMDPVYRPDQHVLLLREPTRARLDRDFVLRNNRTDEGRLCQIVRVTASHWHARQYNPKRTVPLSRKRWRVAWEIRGWHLAELRRAHPNSDRLAAANHE